MLIRVNSQLRLRLKEERQTLPFSIWSCEELLDETSGAGAACAMAQCKEKILHRLIAITHGNEQLQSLLKQDYWQAMRPEKFSFAVAGMLGVDSDLAQSLLEMTDTQLRLNTILEIINGIG
jgi:Lon protease-like protein